MLRHVLRSVAVASGAFVAMAAYASPAAADEVVPSGCAGTIYYACTGEAEPENPNAYWFPTKNVVAVPVDATVPAIQLLPGQTVGGQPIGGVIVVGGQTVPGTSTEVGGPTDPIDTGIGLPVQVCAFVVCYPSGTPVVVPGLPLPVVPVTIQDVEVPSEEVSLPVIGTVPTVQTPPVGTQPSGTATTVTVWEYPNDYLTLGTALCEAGGGSLGGIGPGPDDVHCTSGVLAPAANVLLDRWNESYE